MGSSGQSSNYDLPFKTVMIGDSGVGKSSLLGSFTSNSIEDLPPNIGVDFAIKLLTVGGKELKLTIWDSRTGAVQNIDELLLQRCPWNHSCCIIVYDVTRRETFTNLSDVWIKEVDIYSTNQESEKAVSSEEGMALVKELGCLFIECSAKTRVNVDRCFQELALKIMEVPSSLKKGSTSAEKDIVKPKPENQTPTTGGGGRGGGGGGGSRIGICFS